jgi:geranylgeranyl pyrophosphate synthase
MNQPALFDQIRKKVTKEMLDLPAADKIPLFYEPIYFINRLQGKKIRPLLTVLSGLAVGGRIDDLCRPAAAIELLHNFSLVHDDIMDNDDTRRGEPTVHEKWDLGTAILAGDRKLLQTPGEKIDRITTLFTDAMLEICEGQALDKTFESIPVVTEEMYLEMIGKKTARLIRLSCEIGAIVGGGREQDIQNFAEFGYHIGMGFQIQDDLLDIFADEKTLGKRVGSDLAMDKKTIAMIRLKSEMPEFDARRRGMAELRDILRERGIFTQIEDLAAKYFMGAQTFLSRLDHSPYIVHLESLSDYLLRRNK